MKQGLELFKVRTGNFLDLKCLERKYDFIFPPIYKSFVQLFEEEIVIDKYISPISKRKDDCYAIKLVNDDGEIDDMETFHSFIGNIEQCLKAYFTGNNYWDQLYKEGNLLPIGESQSSDVYALGFKGDRVDQIWMFDEMHEDGLWKVSDNIFEFINKLRLVELNFLNYEYSHFYKNWGEDFWRVREEKKKANI